MRGIPSLFLALAVLAVSVAGPTHVSAQSVEDLAGGWIVTSWTSEDGEVLENPQRGLFIFTATGHYSIMYVNSDEPRPNIQDDGTDADIVEAFNTFTANSGRYVLEGNQLTYEAYVAKWPNYMNSWDMANAGNARTVTVSLDGGILTLTWEGGSKVSLRRPGQGG